MVVEVAPTCTHWSKPLVPHSTCSSSSQQQTCTAVASSPISSRGRRTHCWNRGISCQKISPSGFLGRGSSKLLRSSSFQYPKRRSQEQCYTLRRAISATLEKVYDDDAEGEEEFQKKLQELALRFDEDPESVESTPELRNPKGESTSGSSGDSPGIIIRGLSSNFFSPVFTHIEAAPPPWMETRPEPPGWRERPDIIPASVERNANSVDLPLSLRMIKKKKWEEGFREAGESACCSMRKAFSSMVFIIRELQCYTLQMREILFYEDLRGILCRVQQEMHASFCWLFQQIFSSTPTLMVSVMLLLANFTVYSMAYNVAMATPPPLPQSIAAVSFVDTHRHINQQPKFDSSSFKISVGKTAFVGGNGGGGHKVRPVGGATDDGRSEHQRRAFILDGVSAFPSTTRHTDGEPAEEEAAAVPVEEETSAWNRIIEEAAQIQASSRDEALMDPETLQQFVSPVTAEMDPEGGLLDYCRTELMYQQAVDQEPDNPLILTNYAQFLHLVVRDCDRAEYYFRRATAIQPPDPEALSRYASFLWVGRKDLEAAEETYLEAIAADPGNTYHAGNYANFLWNTGGEDTCYPLNGGDDA